MNGVWILLGILKWLGIVLLGLLLLLFVILGVVLLSPIRYHLKAEKAEEIGGSFAVSYLCGAVKASGSYTPEHALQIKVKVLWFTLLGGEPKEEKEPKKKKEKHSKKEKKQKKQAEPVPLAAAEKAPQTERAEPKKPAEPPKEAAVSEAAAAEEAEKPKPKQQSKTVRRVKISEVQEKPPADTDMVTLAEDEAFFTGEEPAEEEKKERIPPIVKQIWGIQDKKGILKALQKLLKRLIKGILPGNLFLKGTIGTGDPTSTGYVLAAAGVLTTKFGEDMQIKGDFGEKKAEDIEVRINGKIVLGYLAWSVLAFAAAKPVRRAIWYMIKELRKKDK